MTLQPHILRPSEQAAVIKKKKALKTARLKKSSIPPIELYQKENCPDSHAVRNRLSDLGLDFVAHSVPEGDSLKHEQLVQASGRDRVPFLMDHSTGVKLYESGAILSYLEKQYGKPARTPLLRAVRRINVRIQLNAQRLVWAVRSPLERARVLRSEAKETWNSLESSWNVLREAFGEPDQRKVRRGGAKSAAKSLKFPKFQESTDRAESV